MPQTESIGASHGQPGELNQRGLSGLKRGYDLHPNFPLRWSGCPAQAATMGLLRRLDDYRLETPLRKRHERPRLFARALPTRTPNTARPGTKSSGRLPRRLLLCNYKQCTISVIRSVHSHSKPAAGRGHRARRRLDRQQLEDDRRLRSAISVCPHSQERNQSWAALLNQSRTPGRVATSSSGRRQTRIC